MPSPRLATATTTHAPAQLSSFTCVWAAITAGGMTCAFETLHHAVLPNVSQWTSRLASIGFAAIAAAIGCGVVVNMSRRLHQHLRREVSARKEAEQFFRVIAVATNAGIWNWDLATDITWFNPEFVEGYGYALEDALAPQFWRSHVHPDDRERVCQSLCDAVAGQDESWTEEYRFRRADGSYAYIRDRGVVFRDEQGRALRVCGGMIDLTERKKAQSEQARALRALQSSEAAFRSLFENAPFGMYRSTVDGKLLDANPALVKMLGYETVEELHRLSCGAAIYVRPEDRAVMVKQLVQDKSVTGLELEWKRKDGKPIVVRFSARICEDGDHPFFECTAEDITQRRELQQELQQSQKMEAIGQLAGGVAHDFNNMLLIIRMGSELVQSSFAPDDRRRKRTDEIIKTCDRAAALTQQLLAFGRRQMSAPQLLNLNTAVADAMNMIHRLLGDSIVLTFQAAPVACTAMADPSQVVQVLMNLCINARDAMPHGGALDVRTDLVVFTAHDVPAGLQPGPYSLLRVQDTGSGMSQDVLAHLFEPFFTTKQKGEHSGLGLSTVYGIVKQSGGTVLVESEPGHGSTFQIFLPHVAAQTLEVSASHASQEVRSAGESILVVEDEPALRKAVSEFLRLSGFLVRTAENGEDALNVVAGRLNEIDLLVTDVAMPRMGGRELAERLTAMNPQLKVIFMSGYSDDAELRESILAGAAFLQKPFQCQTLLQKINEMLVAPVPASHSALPLVAHGECETRDGSLRYQSVR